VKNRRKKRVKLISEYKAEEVREVQKRRSAEVYKGWKEIFSEGGKDIPPGGQKIDGKIFKGIIQVIDFKGNKNNILLQFSGIKFAVYQRV
jgi:hypothetical protein